MVFGMYLMAAPFVPQLLWKLNPPDPAVYSSASKATKPAPIPTDNLLIIPRLGMQQVIHDGPYQSELNKGVWLVPHTSQPDKQSNTVIIGHRFTYAGPAVFYFLDKVQKGDTIIVDWHGKEYTYRVNTIREVEPTEVSVEDPTAKPQLTLYTCTPLWTSRHRLVLVAPLQGVRS
jgi:sortase A